MKAEHNIQIYVSETESNIKNEIQFKNSKFLIIN